MWQTYRLGSVANSHVLRKELNREMEMELLILLLLLLLLVVVVVVVGWVG